mgnify:CR=1 FL=1
MPPREPEAFKHFRAGTHRTVSPEETLARVRPFLPQMGVTRVANVTGLDRLGIPVAMAYRPNSRSLVVSPGKGLTLAADELRQRWPEGRPMAAGALLVLQWATVVLTKTGQDFF